MRLPSHASTICRGTLRCVSFRPVLLPPFFFQLVAAEPNVGLLQTAWVGFTTIFGVPVLMRLRRLIKQARIESIMKGH